MVQFYDEDEDELCSFCDGSGEGYAPDSRCQYCSPTTKKEKYYDKYGDRDED